MTKAEEIAALARFLESIPAESYLSGFMAGADEAFSHAVANDLSFPTLAQIWSDRQKEKFEAAEQSKQLRNQLEALRVDVRQADRALRISREELNEIRNVARRLAAV